MFSGPRPQPNEQSLKLRSLNRYKLGPKGLRKYSICAKVKPLAQYHKKEKKKLKTHCKTCEKNRQNKYWDRVKSDISTYCQTILPKVKKRALHLGVPFSLTPSDLVNIWNCQSGCCFYTGDPMNLLAKATKPSDKHPDFPTLDRIHVDEGYIPSNTVWCKWQVNKMKSDMSVDHFINLCQKVLTLHRSHLMRK